MFGLQVESCIILSTELVFNFTGSQRLCADGSPEWVTRLGTDRTCA